MFFVVVVFCLFVRFGLFVFWGFFFLCDFLKSWFFLFLNFTQFKIFTKNALLVFLSLNWFPWNRVLISVRPKVRINAICCQRILYLSPSTNQIVPFDFRAIVSLNGRNNFVVLFIISSTLHFFVVFLHFDWDAQRLFFVLLETQCLTLLKIRNKSSHFYGSIHPIKLGNQHLWYLCTWLSHR